ncbi:hypothetical protein [Massilia sp. H6]|uniref:hypothetical protein n=1 Tax=Massilia sp. H6 TaxID=2970464 RepID=UPI002167E105|nr:hypothetical protein [Massilia sp. H6]UVW30301.1 hypothetical protein NRS07_09330 [Massilia sp. H6]
MAFLLLFPGFFFYHTLLGLGIIPALLGGYFSPVALLFTLPIIGMYFIAARKKRNFFLEADLFFMLFVAYYALVLMANFAAGTNSAIVQKHMFSMIFCVDVYIVFRMIDLSDRKFIAMAAASLAFMSAITIYFSIDGFFYLRSLDEASNPESLATYQGFARSYIYTFLIVIAVVKSIGVRFLLYGLAACSLFLNGARSEFSAVLFVVPIIEFYYAKSKVYSMNLVFFLFIWIGANADSIVGALPDNRILQLFDLSHSSSNVAREQLSKDAWRTITENPIFGDFGSYADGHYAHNILCAWVDFGLIGFLILGGMLVWSASRLFMDGYFLRKKSPDFILACCFVCISILWALTAKSVPDMSVGAALGAFAKYRYTRRNETRLPHHMTSSPQPIGAM